MATESSDPLSPNKQALLKIRQLKKQLADVQSRQHHNYEPLAIVSMACRFPRHARTPEQFWDCLVEQTDEISEVPEDRWDLEAFFDQDSEVPGHMYARHGCFLDQVDQMDPEFFGISPREATWIDPQQRLLLEVAWEALERAGWVPGSLAGNTGVFVGWMHNDYQNESSDSFLNLNPYIATGAAGSFLSGRLAHCFGFSGPSLAVDTACSSSLVALHQACQSLQRRDCDQAIVGGVNVICSPTTNILTCQLKALSPSGRSRAFDAAADGYLRGEGCGVVALRRLVDAEAKGDTILGIIRGSAVGHNGSGGGLTVPNPHSQAEVIRKALQRAQISPEEVTYLEAHGTGTELGDPIEMQAAATALAAERHPDRPLLVGSVKTNIGHLEAAAGMAGLIKVLLALGHGKIPGQLHFEHPNPHIPWDRLPVKVLTEQTDWPAADRRIAGVSAFGMSGTNAHVVLESAATAPKSPVASASPADAKSSSEASSPPAPLPASGAKRASSPIGSSTNLSNTNLIVLSGKSEQAVAELAERYELCLSEPNAPSLPDVAYTTGARRSHFAYRASLVVDDQRSAIESLRTIARGGTNESAFSGIGRKAPKVAWQFTGQGAQYVGMCRRLYQVEPVFAAAIDHCDELLKEFGRRESLVDVLFEHPGLIDHTTWTQPGIFAIQMGLAKLLASSGLTPEVVFGHSVGQYAAACVAGMMSWDDGLRLIAQRGRLIGGLPESGRMLAVFMPAPQVLDEIDAIDGVSVAAFNGTHTVVSGVTNQIDALAQRLEQRGVRSRPLSTSHAFHSELMEPVLEPFRKFADEVNFDLPQIPLICNMTGQPIDANVRLDGHYWSQHIRQGVRFADCVTTAQQLGSEILLELGPQAVLTRMATANWAGAPKSLISVLDRELDDQTAWLRALGQLYVQGATADFEELYKDKAVKHVALPTYPFQRRRFWGPAKPGAMHSDLHTAHPLLGSPVPLAAAKNELRYESYIEPDSPSWLADHQVLGRTVVPGAAYIEMAITAADGKSIADIQFEQPCSPAGRTCVQTLIRDSEDSTQSIEIYSSNDANSDWIRHFSAKQIDQHKPSPPMIDRQSIVDSCDREILSADFYARMQEIGLEYGDAFQTIKALHYGEHQLLAQLGYDGDLRGYHIAPNLLDGAIHALAVGLQESSANELFLPVGAKSVTVYQPAPQSFWSHAKWDTSAALERAADLWLFDDNGNVIAEIEKLTVRAVSRQRLRRMNGAGPERLVHELDWKKMRLPTTTTVKQSWLVVHGVSNRSAADQIAQHINQHGHACIDVDISASGLEQVAPQRFQIDGRLPDQWRQVMEKFRTADSAAGFGGIVWLIEPTATSSEAPDDPITNAEFTLTSLLSLVHTLLERNHRRIECGVALVTTEAIATGELPTCDPAQALYWGFGRVLGAEQPEFRCRMIDMPAHWDGNDQSLSRLLDLLLTETDDNQFAIRDDQYLVPRLQKRLRARAVDQPFAVDADGSVLITGGLGALGRRAAQWLADKGARQIVLVSRGEPNESTHQWIESVEQTGCQVIHEPVDLSIPEDVYQLIGRFGKDWKPLAGIIHAAGVVDDGLIDTQSWERFRNVLAAKITGVTALHEATKELPLDFFILYSSAAAVLGSPGQSSYAAANSYLDALAWQRRAKGLPAISINWGPWSEGMADDERIRKRLALQGITPLAADEAHQTIEQILAAALPQATVLDVDWRRMRMGMGGQTPAMLADLIPARQQAGKTDSALVAKLKQLADSERRSLLIKNVQETLQRILSTSEPPEIDRPLIEMGLDSLMAVEFGTELQQLLGDEFAIGPTMLFDHPTIEAISEYVLGLLAGTPEEPAAVPATPASASAENENVQREPIAVIGMSCQFPGADDTDEFWSNLIQGVDSVSEIPADRWDVDKFYSADRQPGRMYTRHGGFLKKISEFDARFFNISDVEACWIDPQHRLLLENTYHALEDAGICTSPLPDPRVGVFMGIMGQDYAFLPHLEDQNIVSAFQGAGLSHSAGVGRISYIFGFEGPSIAVDTASSSSLVAVLQAVRSLQDHHCNAAVAGGVNAILAPVNSLLMSKAGLLSADGRCKSFSAAADGFGRGEGCGVIVLKRLSDAQKDGDRVLALIRGGAIVHNGFSSGITSPSGKAQSRVIRAALEDASLAPAQIQYLEAHGTGTEFGDPLELGAAAAVYGKGRKQGHPLWVGSVKGNISHLEAAGGVSGLIKTILSIDRGVIPPQIHFDEPNPHVPWSRLPLQIVTDPTPWPEGPERLAGVTALGLVGTNAHVLVSSPPVSQQTSDDQAAMPSANASVPSPLLLMISARDPSGLRRLARSYRSFIDEHREIDLPAICYTAAVGRRHFEHRLALTVDSHEVAIDKLDAFLQDRNRSSSQVANGRGSSNGSTRHESGQLLASSGVAIGTVKETIKIGWLFTGDPASRLAAACQLYQTQPVVRELVDQLDRKLAEHSTRQSVSIPSLGQTFQTDSTGNGQPRVPPDVQLFALQCGLAKLWRSWGIEPDLALGFGVGAYTAACAAGVMDFADATLLVFERQRILSAVTENTSSDGSSSPTPATEDALAAFESLADRLDYYPPNLSLVCSQTGQQVPIHRALGGSYWTQLLTADLAVADSLRTLTDSNCDFLLQLGPDGRLGSGNERVSDFETTARQLVSIELGQDPLRTMTHILGQLYAAGINPNYREFDYAVDRRKLSLPKYPFHRQRYWITEVDQYLDSSLEQAQT